MVTTAARSRDYMRKLGYTAECVEHRRGSFIRVDLFGFADVMIYGFDIFDRHASGELKNLAFGKIMLIQAYCATKHNIKKHAHLNSSYPKIKEWLQAGGRFEHHLWFFKTKNKRKYWSVERREIT